MYKGSMTEEARELLSAIELIQLGARMQVLEKELNLSRARLIRLYRELKNSSPPQGMLPISADWYFTLQPNIHASLFYNIYLFLVNEAKCSRLDALTRAYRLYLEHCESTETESVLSFTRAWTLLRFFEAGRLKLTCCTVCSGRFVRHMDDEPKTFTCCFCAQPSRMGATRTALSRLNRKAAAPSPSLTGDSCGATVSPVDDISRQHVGFPATSSVSGAWMPSLFASGFPSRCG